MILNLRKTGANALSLLASDVLNRATSFVLYALVARHLGAREFGQLALALSLFYSFQVLAVAGLRTLVLRQVSQHRDQTAAYLITGSMIAVLSSLGSVLMLFGFNRLMHYPADTSRVILLLSLGLLPCAFSAVCEAVFQAWERMHYIAYVNVPVNFIKVVGAFLLLSTGHGLDAVVLIVLFSLTATAGVEAWILVQRFPRQPASFDLRFSLSTMRSASTFLGIDGTNAIMSSLNIILLSWLTTEAEVGLYCAATQVTVPLHLVYQSIALSIFPVMCQKVEPGLQGLKQIAERAIELLLGLALPAVAGFFFLGDWALSVIYKSPVFLQAFPALQIVAWVLIFQLFSSVLGQVLLANHRERTVFRIGSVDVLVNLLVGWPLISYFGLIGAAMALLVTRIADSYQHYALVWRLFSGFPLGKVIWKPIVAAACMAAYLALPEPRAGILTGVAAAAIYAVALLALTVWMAGGLRQFREKYSLLLSK